MKQCFFLAAMVAACSNVSYAGACASASLAGYIGLGSGGCTIGGNTVHDFQILSGTAGATAIAPSDIGISPMGGTNNPGFSGATNLSATSGSLLEAIFTYQISGNSYTGSSITLGGSSETVDGAVSYTQNFCAGGTFGPDGVTGCSGGGAGSLATVDGAFNQDSAAFSPVGFVSVTDDFTLDGGPAGSASGGAFTDQFTATPEPATFLLTGLALAIAVGLKLQFLTLMNRGDNKRTV